MFSIFCYVPEWYLTSQLVASSHSWTLFNLFCIADFHLLLILQLDIFIIEVGKDDISSTTLNRSIEQVEQTCSAFLNELVHIGFEFGYHQCNTDRTSAIRRFYIYIAHKSCVFFKLDAVQCVFLMANASFPLNQV